MPSRAHRVAFAALALLGCGGGGDDASSGFDGPPSSVVTSDDGALRVEVRTSPNPPLRGTNEVELRFARVQDGSPVDDLAVTVVPWMPAMGHGASVRTTVTPKGDGHYLIDNVSTFMPGRWELRTTIAGPPEDHATLPIDVP